MVRFIVKQILVYIVQKTSLDMLMNLTMNVV